MNDHGVSVDPGLQRQNPSADRLLRCVTRLHYDTRKEQDCELLVAAVGDDEPGLLGMFAAPFELAGLDLVDITFDAREAGGRVFTFTGTAVGRRSNCRLVYQKFNRDRLAYSATRRSDLVVVPQPFSMAATMTLRNRSGLTADICRQISSTVAMDEFLDESGDLSERASLVSVASVRFFRGRVMDVGSGPDDQIFAIRMIFAAAARQHVEMIAQRVRDLVAKEEVLSKHGAFMGDTGEYFEVDFGPTEHEPGLPTPFLKAT